MGTSLDSQGRMVRSDGSIVGVKHLKNPKLWSPNLKAILLNQFRKNYWNFKVIQKSYNVISDPKVYPKDI